MDIDSGVRQALFKHWFQLSSIVSVQFSCSLVSDSLQPHGLQHTRPPCSSLTPRVYSNSCPLSQWCHPAFSSSVVHFSRHPSFPASVFSNESVLRIRWPKYRSFCFSSSPSNEYSGLISFRMDWLDLLAVQGTLKSLLQHHSSDMYFGTISLSLSLAFPYSWKGHIYSTYLMKL